MSAASASPTSPIAAPTPTFEIIDTAELARRWSIPKSWLVDKLRRRSSNKPPHLKFGKYRRFEWNSPALLEWYSQHRSGGKQ